MPELSTMMRAMELQKTIEDKVSEWRQRSTKVAGKSVADSYQQPINFKRQVNRRKNSAEINKIISKYSKPTDKNAGERHYVIQRPPSPPPVRPPRVKKANLSKSVDNLTTIDMNPQPPVKNLRKKYAAKSHEDLTAFVDINRAKNNSYTKEFSIMDKVSSNERKERYSVNEKLNYVDVKDIEINKRNSIATSTPVTKRKSSLDERLTKEEKDFQKCINYGASVSDLRKGVSEPNILNVSGSRESLGSTKTMDYKKKWKILKKPFRKGTLDRLMIWKNKKFRNEHKTETGDKRHSKFYT